MRQQCSSNNNNIHQQLKIYINNINLVQHWSFDLQLKHVHKSEHFNLFNIGHKPTTSSTAKTTYQRCSYDLQLHQRINNNNSLSIKLIRANNNQFHHNLQFRNLLTTSISANNDNSTKTTQHSLSPANS